MSDSTEQALDRLIISNIDKFQTQYEQERRFYSRMHNAIKTLQAVMYYRCRMPKLNKALKKFISQFGISEPDNKLIEVYFNGIEFVAKIALTIPELDIKLDYRKRLPKYITEHVAGVLYWYQKLSGIPVDIGESYAERIERVTQIVDHLPHISTIPNTHIRVSKKSLDSLKKITRGFPSLKMRIR